MFVFKNKYAADITAGNGVFGFCVIGQVTETGPDFMPIRAVPLDRVALVAVNEQGNDLVGCVRGGGSFSSSCLIPWRSTRLLVDGRIKSPSPNKKPVVSENGDVSVYYGHYNVLFVRGQNLLKFDA